MKLPVKLLPEAKKDINEIVSWYEKHNKRMAKKFLENLKLSIANIEKKSVSFSNCL